MTSLNTVRAILILNAWSPQSRMKADEKRRAKRKLAAIFRDGGYTDGHSVGTSKKRKKSK